MLLPDEEYIIVNSKNNRTIPRGKWKSGYG